MFVGVKDWFVLLNEIIYVSPVRIFPAKDVYPYRVNPKVMIWIHFVQNIWNTFFVKTLYIKEKFVWLSLINISFIEKMS